jgi:hypothetical protein
MIMNTNQEDLMLIKNLKLEDLKMKEKKEDSNLEDLMIV